MGRRSINHSGGMSLKVRIGKVTNIYPSVGKVKVIYEDAGNTSLPLSMLTMNREYSMPKVGDKVLTIHMGNGSSKGFVLGTYYGGNMRPKAGGGYRKDFEEDAYVVCESGIYKLSAKSTEVKAVKGITIESERIVMKCAYGEISLENLLKRLERVEDQLGLPHTV